MQIMWKWLLVTAAGLLFIIYLPIFAYSEVDMNQEAIWEDEKSDVDVNFTGNLTFSSLISTYPHQDISDAVKRNEIKTRASLKYGTDTFYIRTAARGAFHLSFFDNEASDVYSNSKHWEFSRSLRISSSKYELAFNELYINYALNMVRFRIGNQVFDWGTTLFSPTTYFNPGDWRELFFNMMQEDAIIGVPSVSWLGTPAVSAMMFMGDYACEVVASPIHTPMLLPLNNSFWSVKMDSDLFVLLIDQPEEMDVALENTGFGIRVSGTVLDMDISVSAFHGPDREAVLIPHAITLLVNQPVTVIAQPQNNIINMIGMDFSYSQDNYGIHFEAVYSPEKHFMPDFNISMVDENMRLPLEDVTSPYTQFAVGINYFMPLYKVLKGHQGVSVLYVEYLKATKFDNTASSTLFPDLVLCGYIDSFFDSRIETTVMGVIDQESGSYMLSPQIGYVIRSDLKLKLSYTSISAKSKNDGSMIEPKFYYYRDKDVLMWEVGYTF